MAPEPFQYTPLAPQELRLLRLRWNKQHDGSGADTNRIYTYPSAEGSIQCDIAAYSISDCPPYSALSYAWGQEDATEPLILNQRLIKIKRNLASFLRQAHPDIVRTLCRACFVLELGPCCCGRDSPPERLTREVGFIWIDALCINQDDVVEKTAQIGQMREIYARANRIIIWLGPLSSHSDMAMDLLADLAERRRSADYSPLHFSTEDIVALQCLQKRSWWRRVWVWQEATTPGVPEEFWCGDKRLDFDDAVDANNYIDWNLCNPKEPGGGLSLTKTIIYNSNLNRMKDLQRVRRGQPNPKTRYDLILDHFIGLEATDERDKILAFLPVYQDLTGEHHQPGTTTLRPPPVMNVDSNFASLLHQLVIYILETRSDFTILLYCTTATTIPTMVDHCVHKLPSWVPSFPASAYKDPRLVPGCKRYSAGGTRHDDIVPLFLDDAKTVLRLEGIQIDIVIDTHEPRFAKGETGFYNTELLSRFQRWLKSLAKWFIDTTTGEDFDPGVYGNIDAANHALNLVLTCDVKYGEGESEPASRGNSLALPFFEINKNAVHEAYLQVDENSSSMENKVTFELLTSSPYSLIFRTANGYLGNGGAPEKGDVVVVLLGLPIPLLMRRKAEGWIIVGVCFVAGIMDGEALKMGLATEVFEII
ncbi:heterokaryon incompatibility protein-domain-containing protein [Apodospora peruviana]|uniref:Heterokaryon incompatibility protein-domain-containing protein n=1 Tax=Apodospora peruviana TaxID=516989 RepID=A0AAE0I1U5_9PEZI|nr:heterokaryon incompatibility protein-domain-containing protein [Apodospora peruviana]